MRPLSRIAAAATLACALVVSAASLAASGPATSATAAVPVSDSTPANAAESSPEDPATKVNGPDDAERATRSTSETAQATKPEGAPPASNLVSSSGGFEKLPRPENPGAPRPWKPRPEPNPLEFAAPLPGAPVDPGPEPYLSLQDVIDDYAKRAPCRLGVFCRHVERGETASLNADERFPAMSAIKTALATCVLYYDKEHPGFLERSVAVRPENVVPGSGDLRFKGAGTPVRLRRALELMILESDNVAANTLIDEIGGVRAVNQRLSDLGFENLRLLKKAFFQPLPEYAGLSKTYEFSMITPRETGELFLRMDARRLVDPVRDAALVALLKRPRSGSLKVFLKGRRGVSMANKTGSSNHHRVDSGLIYTPDRGHWVLVVAMKDYPKVSWKTPHPVHQYMANLSWEIYLYFGESYGRPPEE